MEELDYWRLCEELNVVQAALLVVGENPDCAEYVESWDVDKRPKGYEAVKTAILGGLKNSIYHNENWEEWAITEDDFYKLKAEDPHTVGKETEAMDNLVALRRNFIRGVLEPESEFDIHGNEVGHIKDTINVYKSMVNVDSLKQWLRYKGVSKGFFFPEPVGACDFLEPSHPRYAPKLAAAVKAWQAVTDAGGISPKQALNKWLREHAAEFKLTNEDGKPTQQAIDDCCKVANWRQKGGAPKTPS